MKKVPKLRFKEFSDEWQEKKLGEITKITAGGTPSTTKIEYWNGNIKWMNSGELNLKYVYEVQGRITEEGLKNSSTKLIPKNCVLIGLAGQGKTRGTVAINFIELCTNQSIASILPNYQSFIPLFLYFNLDNRYEELRGLSTGGGGRGGLNLGILNSLTSNFPSLQEQEKIANFLSSIDKKISLIEEKLELFREYKKGVMQKIFSQELRFKDSEGNDYPEWEEKKLGEVFERIIEKNVENNTNVLTISAQYGLISQVDFFNKSVAGKDLSKYYLLQKGDFAYNKSYSNGYPMGAIKKLKFYEKGIVSTLYICFRLKNKKYSTNYFEQYFESKKIDKNIQEIAQEGARNHGLLNISVQDFFNIYIPFPLLEEQQKIADFLSSIDSKIENIEKELEGLKEFKKGLLQQMFV
ncbi:MAG: restriction endonuclease subunit S [Fusobacterium mortiferum]|uniref:restriction endonuclease subunit S n=1 Tax=Fusobacterium mortiferum TaxID=850 RepID=UPI002A3573A7|nr:restriction endonuclease subunit S [Fusobacterium mortiferum]MCI7187539.1 restriction endonuclease subunit S [Fusobacterium mortiferum]